MSFIEPATDFITFCRDLADASATFTGTVAWWRDNVVKFQTMFDESPETFEKVFAKFINSHRELVDVSVTNDDGNFDDKWIQIPSSSPQQTETAPGWTSKKIKTARGVVLCLNPDSPKLAKYFLPLSELYSLCCRFHKKETNFSRANGYAISHKIVPLVFMKKLYALLNTVETTYNFDHNGVILDELIESTMEDSDDDDERSGSEGTKNTVSQFDFSKMFSMEGAMSFLSQIDVGAIVSKFAENPEALATAKQMTGLDTTTVTTFLKDIPTVVDALKSTKDSGNSETVIAQALLESDSVHMIAQRYPDKIEAFKKLLEPTKEKVADAATKEEAVLSIEAADETDSADEQE